MIDFAPIFLLVNRTYEIESNSCTVFFDTLTHSIQLERVFQRSESRLVRLIGVPSAPFLNSMLYLY